MTDKQIIIDGVDVHWCEHYTGNIGYLTDKNWTCRAKIQGTKCEDWSNCYFKRWQRKEQECERLKRDYFKQNEWLQEQKKELDQLKAENDNLKSLIWWIHIGAEGADKATTEYYENRNTPYEENYWKRVKALQPCKYESKYKQTLTEIKEIAEELKNFYEELGKCEDLTVVRLKQILQKISEVEDE